MVDLSIDVNGLSFKNPIVCEAAGYVVNEWGMKRMIKAGFGAVVTKTTTFKPFEGGPMPRCYWYDLGPYPAMNGSEALLNPGYKKTAEYLKASRELAEQENCQMIASLSPRSPEEAGTMARELEKAGARAIHMDLQCPTAGVFRPKQYPNENWDHLGGWWSEEVERTCTVIRAVKDAVDVPVWPKPLLYRFKRDSEKLKILDGAGADLYAYTNPGPSELYIDVYTAKRKLNASPGPSRRPILIRDTADFARLTDKPLLPSGGFENGYDLIEAMLVGASLVGFCTAIYRFEYEGLEPDDLVNKIRKQITSYMVRQQKDALREIKGWALKYMPQKLGRSVEYYDKWIPAALWDLVPGPDSEHPW